MVEQHKAVCDEAVPAPVDLVRVGATTAGDDGGRQASLLPWMMGMAQMTKLAAVVEAGKCTANNMAAVVDTGSSNC